MSALTNCNYVFKRFITLDTDLENIGAGRIDYRDWRPTETVFHFRPKRNRHETNILVSAENENETALSVSAKNEI